MLLHKPCEFGVWWTHSGKTAALPEGTKPAQTHMVCEVTQTMAVWKTVLPNSHGLWKVQYVICPSLALLAKDSGQLKLWGNLAKPGYNDKTRGLWLKTAVLGPPKLPSDCSFSRVPRKKVEFWPKLSPSYFWANSLLNHSGIDGTEQTVHSL